MTSSDHSAVSSRELAAAIPDCAAVQVGETFVYVSGEFAATWDATSEELTRTAWHATFPQAVVDHVQEGLTTARADGEWRGEIAVGDDADLNIVTDQASDDDQTSDDDQADTNEDTVEVEDTDGRTTIDLTLRAIDQRAVVWLVDENTRTARQEGKSDRARPVAEEAAPGHDSQTADTPPPSRGPQPPENSASSGGPLRSGPPSSNRGSNAQSVGPGFAHTLLDLIDDGVYVLDESFRVQFVNDRFCELFGRSRETVLGMDGRELYEDAAELDAAEDVRERLLEAGDRRGTITGTFENDEGERVLEARYRLHPEPDGEFRGSVGVVRDVTEREGRTNELRRQRTLIEGILNTIPDVVFAFDEAGEPIVEEAMLDEFAGYSAEELADLGPLGVVPEADRQGVMEQIQAVLVNGDTVTYETDVVAKDGTRIPHEFRAAPLELDGAVLGVVGSARDITERREREAAIARQRDELATLDRINRLLLETTREVIQSGSREAVEHAVCDRLAASELYQFAWVGKQAFDGDEIVPTATAGEDDGYLDEVTVMAEDGETPIGPAGRAMQTGEVQVVDVDDEDSDTWRATACDHGFESVAAVPLVHGDTVYGVLAVYATREDAFSPREQDGFDVLGRSVAAVIHAARSQDLLFADAVVELEFRVTGGGSLMHRTARELDCTLSLDGYVAADDQWIIYLAVEGCRPTEFVAATADSDRVERARVVSETDTGGRAELVVSESVLHAVSEAGASLQAATASPDAVELVVEAPAVADVREVVSHVQREYSAVDLVATRERDREITTVGRPGGLVDELTERQRESLEAAYRAGYFAWPRESTAEEVAASLGLAAPTLHGHLRKAEHQLLAKLFDAGELGGDR